MDTRLACAAVLLSLSIGCAVDEGDGQDGDNADETAEVPTLADRYAFELRSTVITRKKDSNQDNPPRVTIARGTAETKQAGADVELALQLCDVTLPTFSTGVPTISSELIQSVDVIPIRARLAAGDDGTVKLTSDRAALVLGAELADPNDPLPTEEDGAVDQDEDGNPGVTIIVPTPIGEIEVYVAVRLLFELSADIADPAQFSGLSNAELSTEVLADDSFLINAQKMAADAKKNSITVSQDHRFTLTKSTSAECSK